MNEMQQQPSLFFDHASRIEHLDDNGQPALARNNTSHRVLHKRRLLPSGNNTTFQSSDDEGGNCFGGASPDATFEARNSPNRTFQIYKQLSSNRKRGGIITGVVRPSGPIVRESAMAAASPSPTATKKVVSSSLFHSQSLNDISHSKAGLGLEERKHRLADFSQISGLPRRQISLQQNQH